MNFLDIGPLELLLILFLLLLVFGPHKLPEIAAQLGKGYRKLKAATSEMTREMQRELDEAKKETGASSLAAEVAKPFTELTKNMAQMATEMKEAGSTLNAAPHRAPETPAEKPRMDN